MPTPQQLNEELTRRNTKLIADLSASEDRYLLACKEIDLLKKQLNETWELVQRYQTLSNGLAKPAYIPEPPKSRIEPNI